MPGIFNDEYPKPEPILVNPEGTLPILPLDVTLSGLKGATLLCHTKLARNKMGNASTTT